MDRDLRNRLVLSASLLALLFTTKFTIDKATSALNTRIINYGTTQEEDVNLVAHRGYSNTYPDNTLEGITACNDLECIEGIEVDVRLTKDNKLILMHNDYIGFRPISDFTYEELQNMDLSHQIGSRQLLFKGYNSKECEILAKRYETLKESEYTLCTLEDILKNRDKSKILFIDIKFSGYNDDMLISKIGELIKGEENVVIQSFSGELLKQMMDLYPDYVYQLLISSKTAIGEIDYEFDSYGIKYTIVDEGTVKDIIKHDKQVSLWTVNSYKDFKLLQEEYGEYNDDIYYITDNPDLIGYQYSKSKHG